MDIFTQAVYLSCLIALTALSLTIVYNSTKIINFVQGEFIILGAAFAYQAMVVWRWPVIPTIIALIFLTVVAGVCVERSIMMPVRRSGSPVAWIIATLAVAIIVESLYALLFSSELFRTNPLLAGSPLGDAFSWQLVLMFFFSLIIFLVYGLFLNKSIYGSAMRALSTDPETTSTLGVPVKAFVVWSFCIAGLIGALTGFLVAPLGFVSPADGLGFTINGFVAIVLGGLGSVRGALAGGVIVGCLDAIVQNTISPNYGEFFVVLILVIILIIRPQGIFGRKAAG